MADANHFDVVILGAGSGGYACALRAAQLGLRVALVEKSDLGGTCLHEGCIPTKALLHAAEVADATRSAGQLGVLASFDGIDMPAVHAYKDGVVKRLFKGLTGLVAGRGITVISGTGRLTDARTVTVSGPDGVTSCTGDHLVVATGSYARTLPDLAVDGTRVITSEHALTLDSVPRSVAVLGGGVIGCEFASIWRSFGAEVTIIEALPRLMAAEDADSSKQLERAFRKRAIKVLTAAALQKVETLADGVRIHLEGRDPVEVDLLLVAVGRGPRTQDLGLEEVGIAVQDGYVVTDERCRTNVAGVFAVGDVVRGLQLAHRGFAHGILVAEEIAGLDPRPVAEAGIPRVTYCDPELASVGLTQEQAEELHGADQVETVVYDLGGNGKSQILKTQGSIKLVRRADGPVIGIHLVGSRVGELIGEAQLIYNWEAVPADIAPLVHAHPTQNEALGEAHLALAGKPLHAHS